MKTKLMRGMECIILERWGQGEGTLINRAAEQRLAELCIENSGDSKLVRSHTEGKIFPCIACYEALLDHGMPQEEAEGFMDESWSRLAEPEAASMRRLLKIPGLYRIYPRGYSYGARKFFGPEAGFQADFHDTGSHRCRFDMRKCLYKDTCTRYGHPELTKCFCHTDDVNLVGLHPRIGWGRTQCMGCGGEYCDFDVFIIEDDGRED